MENRMKSNDETDTNHEIDVMKERTLKLLNDFSTLSNDLASIPSIVDLSIYQLSENDNSGGDNNHGGAAAAPTSSSISSSNPLSRSILNTAPLTTPSSVSGGFAASINRGQRALMDGLENLTNAKKEPKLELELESPTVTSLTSLVVDAAPPSHDSALLPPSPSSSPSSSGPAPSPSSAASSLVKLEILGKSIPRRVCQHPFRRNDIVWVCRTCQADETCVLCHYCYKHSNHEGHDIAFYHAQAGGCCDCGDPDAWDPAGFCHQHGMNTNNDDDANAKGVPLSRKRAVQGIVPAAAEWLVEIICRNAKRGHARAQMRQQNATSSSTTATSARGSSSRNNPSMESAAVGDDGDEDIDSSSSSSDEEIEDHGHLFIPSVASTSKSRGEGTSTSDSSSFHNSSTPNKAQQLGTLAREEGGIFLVLHADDIKNHTQVSTALRRLFGGASYYTDSFLNKLNRALHQNGQLIVWGMQEVLSEMTHSQRLLWKDGDSVASQQLGALMLKRAGRLEDFTCSIVTRHELQWEQRAVALLEWLTALARSCDPLCQTVAESILPDPHLIPMLESDLLLSANITKAWHALLLTLLAVPTFKSHLAAAYCETYRHVTAEYARGMGVLERSGYTLSVQFLNRVTYVVDLVQHRDLLGKLGKALYETLKVAKLEGPSQQHQQPRRLDPNHFCLVHRRYSPCVSDLKCVLNVKGMARLFTSRAGTFLDDWLASLALAQCMDGQVWRTWNQGHIELEQKGWVGAFNASISLGSLFERLLSWDDNDPSPAPGSILSSFVMTIVELTKHCLLNGLLLWQQKEIAEYEPTSDAVNLDNHHKAPASLPYATVHTGEALAMKALPVKHVSPFSFHLPLHRFVAACLRETCRRPPEQGVDLLLSQVRKEDELFFGLLEFPVVILSRAAQVRAGLWRRNGPPMHDQVLNYAEPPFCRALRDADMLLVQFAALGKGTAPMVNLLIHRFGIFDFCGLRMAPNANPKKYYSQVAAGMYPAELRADENTNLVDGSPMPWTFTAAKDVAQSLALLEDLLHLLIVLISELPPVPPASKAEHTSQAKLRLRREVIHRLASGPKTHSELAEVHHVLSSWDNVFLSEEGKLVNPDDATGAALGATLAEVAERKSIRRLEPDQWELCAEAWDDYDPSFNHISLRMHQGAAEMRPKPKATTDNIYGIEPRQYSPPLPFGVHPSFARLKRDVTSDATVLSVIYRTLHVHCREEKGVKDHEQLRGKLAYDGDGKSETALSRAVHLLTLGSYAWENAAEGASDWKKNGGSFPGSVFYNLQDEAAAPTVLDWIEKTFLADPFGLTDCEWYKGEDTMLRLLKRLAIEDGSKRVGFAAQDQSVRAGAAWLCEFSAKHSEEASKVVGNKPKSVESKQSASSGESELERKKREAKARAMERLNAQAARFAEMMNIDVEDSDEEKDEPVLMKPTITPQEEQARAEAFQERTLSSSSFASVASAPSMGSLPRSPVGSGSFDRRDSVIGEKYIPSRLLKSRPRCIICNEDTTTERSGDDHNDGQRKRSRRKMDGSNALAFVGYAQASAVLKGGGGPPPTSDEHSSLSSMRRFVGTHVALCGHAVHSECCESYLASMLHREDRNAGRGEEFKCPLCQRLSNCLVPFIDVGVDWVDSQYCRPVNAGQDDMDIDDDDDNDDDDTVESKLNRTLDSFLTSTPWWVGRDDKGVVWDRQCAFVAAPLAQMDEVQDIDMTAAESVPSKPRRRSVRSLRKKDLYAAWSAMMRTPRFIRRRQISRSSSLSSDMTATDLTVGIAPTPIAIVDESSSMGETHVWRRFMDLLSEMSYKADTKRLDEQQLDLYFGEFRHYHVEKHAYNAARRAAGEDSADWPVCISPVPFSETRKQELSREKLLSKLLMTIQAFTYSCCSEIAEAKRQILKEKTACGGDLNLNWRSNGNIKAACSKFGASDLVCEDQLLMMPAPSPDRDDGFQPFDGRLGKLRYFGLAVMAAAGAVSADMVQLVLDLPLSREGQEAIPPPPRGGDPEHRSPVVFPVLFGHVLTHVVSAMCAACGRARARSDSLELVWPAPFSKRGSFYGLPKDNSVGATDSVAKDCEGFIKLGVVARVLQVLLGKMQIDPSSSGVGRRVLMIKSIQQSLRQGLLSPSESVDKWMRGCGVLLESALKSDVSMSLNASEAYGSDVMVRFKEACQSAADAAAVFLMNAGTIYQILVPGAAEFPERKKTGARGGSDFVSVGMLNQLITELNLEPLHQMIESPLVKHVVCNWFNSACAHSAKTEVAATGENSSASNMLRRKLFRTQGFRVHDWPMESCKPKGRFDETKKSTGATFSEPQDDMASPMELDSYPSHMRAARAELRPATTRPLVSFSLKKSVELIGGYSGGSNLPMMMASSRPRIHMLPTSYTDLYAELGTLCPDCDQTALCFICGEVLNASGKGECTRHSFKCGAGAGIFFLLQECQGLIMHSGRAVYVQSPYVDSHGETPQYRGRPLNLDLDRYDIFRELWTGHSIRQKVIQERAIARQIIISDFY